MYSTMNNITFIHILNNQNPNTILYCTQYPSKSNILNFLEMKPLLYIFNQIFLSKFINIKYLTTFKHTKETEILGLMHLQLNEFRNLLMPKVYIFFCNF